MSWMSQLYKTYERNIGKSQQDEVPLTPVAHMNANAQVEITLNREGEFLAAEVVDKKVRDINSRHGIVVRQKLRRCSPCIM